MDNEKQCNPGGFVNDMIRRCGSEPACRAAMRRADNPKSGCCAWEYLVPWCDISKDHERLPFALIGAAIARETPTADGEKDIGELFRRICVTEDDRTRERSRFRRIISCDSGRELCDVMRPVLSYLQREVPGQIGYARLLRDMLFWNERVKLRWTANFYGAKQEDEEDVSD